MLARDYRWTPEQIDRLDPAFVDELLMEATARADHELFAQDAKDNPKLQRKQAERKAAIMRW